MANKHITIRVLLLALSFQASAQLVNSGELYVSKRTSLSVHFDAINTDSGDFVNDGAVYYHKNLYNDGLITYTPQGGGITHFVGLENQVIQTSFEADFFQVTFNNRSFQPAFHLNGNIKIGDRASFNSGIVNASSFGSIVTFSQEGYHLGASDDSFVDGRVEKIGFDGFTFPIGDNGLLRPMHTRGDFDHLTDSQYHLENSHLEFSHQKKEPEIVLINDAEYWSIDKLTGQNVLMTIGWTSQTTPSEIITPLDGTSIQVVGWNSFTEKWERKYGVENQGEETITALIDKEGIYTLARAKVKEVFPQDIVIYNGMSPDGDGVNDIFYIENLHKYPRNEIKIFNRWGALVYEAKGYGVSGKWFNGISEGDITVNQGQKLPSGTYFYIIKLRAQHGNLVDKTGYLYIN